jgi:hypothetical protein
MQQSTSTPLFHELIANWSMQVCGDDYAYAAWARAVKRRFLSVGIDAVADALIQRVAGKRHVCHT